jgi:hypothetical protein
VTDQSDDNPENLLSRADDRRVVNDALEQLPIEFRESWC